MPIQTDKLFEAARRRTQSGAIKTIQEARLRGRQTAFLSHSHIEQRLALGLQQLLKEQGWDLYIDWQNIEMPDRPSAEMVAKVREKIVLADWFILLVTAHSSKSRWCSWELGWADGKKENEQIIIAGTSDHHATYGNEYLDIYRRISKIAGKEKYALFETGKTNGYFFESLNGTSEN